MKNVLNINLDKVAIGFSVVCAVHCLFLPVAILLFPAISASIFGHDYLGETGEMILTLIGTGVISFGHLKNQKLCDECCN